MGAYAAAIVHLITSETSLIFKTGVARSDTRPAFPYAQVMLPRADRLQQFAWAMERDKSQPVEQEDEIWLLFLHGNASTIGSRMNVAHYRRLRDLGLNVLAPEYRGYNGLDGVPSEASVGADARAGYDYLLSHKHVEPQRVVIFGWSLGAAVAVDLASQVPQAGVILEGAAASIAAIGQQQYPMFPVRLIIRNPFDAIKKVGRIHSPMLFLHSPEDMIVPYAEGRRLYEAASSPKRFVEVRGGHIEASEIDADVFYDAIKAFLQQAMNPGSPGSEAPR
jgi:pimeloyl-ACP methyl ester carboxylesterase